MSGPIIGVLVALGILYLFGWIAATIWAAVPFLDASLGDRNEGWLTNAVGRVAVWIIATALPIAIGVTLSQSDPQPPETHGSCKIGHRQLIGKTISFVCDEWYPLPQTQEPSQP